MFGFYFSNSNILDLSKALMITRRTNGDSIEVKLLPSISFKLIEQANCTWYLKYDLREMVR